MADEMTGDYLRGYRMAVLGLICELCVSEHMGDVFRAARYFAKRCSIVLPENSDGEPDSAAIEAMIADERNSNG
jgi:hypothetical protein